MSARLNVANSGARLDPARRIPVQQTGLVRTMAVLNRIDIECKGK
jgi:hypothetical protein